MEEENEIIDCTFARFFQPDPGVNTFKSCETCSDGCVSDEADTLNVLLVAAPIIAPPLLKIKPTTCEDDAVVNLRVETVHVKKVAP